MPHGREENRAVGLMFVRKKTIAAATPTHGSHYKYMNTK